MKTLEVKLPRTRYTLWLGENLLEKMASLIDFPSYSQCVVVFDEKLEHLERRLSLFLAPSSSRIALRATEPEKTIETVATLWREFHRLGVDRKSLIINLGGGVLGDLSGFAASTF